MKGHSLPGINQRKSPAKQGLILDKRTSEQKIKDQKSKELWDKTVNIKDIKGLKQKGWDNQADPSKFMPDYEKGRKATLSPKKEKKSPAEHRPVAPHKHPHSKRPEPNPNPNPPRPNPNPRPRPRPEPKRYGKK